MDNKNDHVGNTAGKVIHGVKKADYSHNGSNKSYCGLLAWHWVPKSEVGGMVQQITCKACRKILGLSNKHNEKPDYYLILDTGGGEGEFNSTPVAVSEDIDEIKEIIDHEIERVGLEYIEDNYRVVGIKEMEDILISIKPKGYEITLTKQ